MASMTSTHNNQLKGSWTIFSSNHELTLIEEFVTLWIYHRKNLFNMSRLEEADF